MPGSRSRQRPRRIRPTAPARRTGGALPRWLALVAAWLNAMAPALAYALDGPLHGTGAGHPLQSERAVLQARCHALQPSPAAPAGHAHAGQRVPVAGHDALALHAHASPTGGDAPAAPHCPYCLDFAAGAALLPAVPCLVAPQVAFAAVAAASVRVAALRPSLRLPRPRGPPAVA